MTATSLTWAQQDSLPAKKVSFHTIASGYLPYPQLQVINYNLGTEISLKNRNTININLGYLNKSNPIDNDIFQIKIESTKGFRGQFEVKHYLNRHKLIEPLIFFSLPHIFQFKSQAFQNTGYYISGLISYQNTTSERIETIINYNTTSNQYLYSNYSVLRNSVSLIAKGGYSCIKSYGLLIDISYGIGAIWLDSKAVNKQTQQSIYYFSWKNDFDHRQGIFPQVWYQVKLGWVF